MKSLHCNFNKLFACFLIFAASIDTAAQKHQVEFLFTSKLTDEDVRLLSELMKDLGKTYLFRAKSIYSEESSKPVSTGEEIRTKIIHNANIKFTSVEELRSARLSLSGYVNRGLEYSFEDQYTLNNLDKSSIRGLRRYIKRLIKFTPEGKNTRILWFNEFIPYLISCEMLKSIESSNGNQKLTKVHLDYEEEHYFRPVGVAYKIEFDSVGIFDAYRLVITETKNGKAIFDEVMKVEPHTSYEADNAYCISSPVSRRKCIFYIDQEQLFKRCVQELGKLGETGITCGECEHECLYKHSFSISIRGVVTNGECEANSSSEIEPVYLQCAKGK